MTYNVAKLIAAVLIFVATIVGMAVDAITPDLGALILTGLVAYIIGNMNVTDISSIVEKNKE